MKIFKRITRKVTSDVKEVLKDEAKKSKDEIKKGLLNTVAEALPVIAAFVGALILVSLFKKPTPVVVKVVVEHK